MHLMIPNLDESRVGLICVEEYLIAVRLLPAPRRRRRLGWSNCWESRTLQNLVADQAAHLPYGTVLDPMYIGCEFHGAADVHALRRFGRRQPSIRWPTSKIPVPCHQNAEAMAAVAESHSVGVGWLVDVGSGRWRPSRPLRPRSGFAVSAGPRSCRAAARRPPAVWVTGATGSGSGHTSRDQYMGVLLASASPGIALPRSVPRLRPRHPPHRPASAGQLGRRHAGRQREHRILAAPGTGARDPADRPSGQCRALRFDLRTARRNATGLDFMIGLEATEPSHSSYFKFNLDAITLSACSALKRALARPTLTPGARFATPCPHTGTPFQHD